MYYSCHCIKRNGLQHDCRRTGCGGEPACLVLPDPLCAPSQLARARGLADPAPLAAHLHAQAGGSGAPADPGTSSGGGKRFIVCELKGMIPDAASNQPGQCCNCKFTKSGESEIQYLLAQYEDQNTHSSKCSCSCKSGNQTNPLFVFNEQTTETILNRFQNKELRDDTPVLGPGGRVRKPQKPSVVEECTRPGCVHWKPPPPCLWSAPCKADCFETPPGIQPHRNIKFDSNASGLTNSLTENKKAEQKMILLTQKQ